LSFSSSFQHLVDNQTLLTAFTLKLMQASSHKVPQDTGVYVKGFIWIVNVWLSMFMLLWSGCRGFAFMKWRMVVIKLFKELCDNMVYWFVTISLNCIFSMHFVLMYPTFLFIYYGSWKLWHNTDTVDDICHWNTWIKIYIF